MAVSSPQNEILRQLADIQRSLGETSYAVQSLHEDIQVTNAESAQHRSLVTGQIDNIVERVGSIEHHVHDVKEKLILVTNKVDPMFRERVNWRQRTIGFVGAFSLIGAVAGGISYLFSNISPYISKWFR